MNTIEHITAREIVDSRGTPTVQATIHCTGGYSGTASVPSGASTGDYEAFELRDHDHKRFAGNGVLKAVHNIQKEIAAVLKGHDVTDQRTIDHAMIQRDGTMHKSVLGANAILAVSLAAARVAATVQGVPLYRYIQHLAPGAGSPVMPIPHINVINGGKHAHSNLAIQEYQIIPIGANTFSEALRMGIEIYHALKKLLIQEGFRTEVGDEAGFAPDLTSSELVFNLLVRAIETAGYEPGIDVFLGMDAAASEFYDSELHHYTLDSASVSPEDLLARYTVWRERYPLLSFEDPFDQDQWETWKKFTQRIGSSAQIVGDDLFVTNVKRLEEGIKQGIANAVIIKPNQVGTLTETLQTVSRARQAGYRPVISHRSGETEDTFIADLCVGVGAGQIKTGAPARGERTAKYNRLLEIEEEIHAPLSQELHDIAELYRTRYRDSAIL